MVKRVRNSKRVSLKLKFKVERKVKEHHRKQRRETRKAAKNGIIVTKRNNKDVGLPNLMPYKAKFLKEINAQHQLEIDQQNARQFKRRDELLKQRIETAAERSKEFEQKQDKESLESNSKNEIDESTGGKVAQKKKRQYLKEITKVVDLSDIVLMVLDARDPLSSRASLVEDLVASRKGKKLVFILNKIDLIPKTAVDSWLSHLRQFHPTVAFRSSRQNQKSNLSRALTDHISLAAAGESTGSVKICIGGDTLLQLLKNYSRMDDLKSAITVGVVGYPNVGKSSLINSLKRAKSAGVSPTAGFTKALQVVQLDKKVKLIDSPGVLFLDSTQETVEISSLVLRNCVNVGEVQDPVGCVRELATKVDHEKLMVLYRLKRFSTVEEMLRELAFKRGKLKKGGIPDVEAAARVVLLDLNVGKISYFVPPPETETSAAASMEVDS